MTNKIVMAYMINIRKRGHIGTIVALLLCSLLIYPEFSIAGTYLSTKHGDSTDGVNRSVVTSSAYPDATNTYPTGHCGHCHEQHTSIDGAEPTLPSTQGPSEYALFKDNYGGSGTTNELCFACHEQLTIGSMTATYGEYGIYQGKTKYNASIHGTDTNVNWSPDASPPGPPFGPNSTLTDDNNCHNCHNPHGYDDGSGLVPNMLFARDSKTGDSPEYEMGCEACHDGTQASTDVQAELANLETGGYGHPTHTYNNRHTLPENGTSFETRHAECVDCHNPHTALSGTHTAGTTGNAVSNALKYVWGVEPTWPSNWTAVSTFTERKPPTYTDGALYEYQICFKCHSDYGLGTVTAAMSTIGSGSTLVTDQAWEFNPNNASFHPVVSALGAGTGSTNTLEAAQMTGGWSAGDTMYCSDCHNTDDAAAAQGPHGSTVKWMLSGTNKAWPYTTAALNGTSGTTNFRTYNDRDTSVGTDDGLFCNNCHTIDASGHVHSDDSNHRSAPCVGCHIRVPHGGKVSRLIAAGNASNPLTVVPARYAPNGNGGGTGYVRKFTKATTYSGYSKSYCYSSNGSCGDHSSSSNGTESW